ncbi:hypothetical protein ATO6_09750 [Oceanicola sp. 22II-s10i]|uniref:hypothetical protein n=1 Tax=Oceanicola sp. 22II-s10i TaxID=1317116 RepID=UPI000B51F90A|nr:hypothetical protein [Oceanicola sp. 22II-s10i]OWU85291.1 hypothetical protein ATO6_09750 [Oceanicola sp. 22II-s10i]
MPDAPGPLFYERRTYRRRRLADLSRLLPVAGLILMLVPLFWGDSSGSTVPMSLAILYIFGLWFALVIAGALLSLNRPEELIDPQAPRSPLPGEERR